MAIKEKHHLACVYFFYAALFILTLILFFIPENTGLSSTITGSAIYLAPIYEPETLKIISLPIILGIMLFLILEGFKNPKV